MDGVSASLTVISAFKEVYLLSRFVWKVASTAANGNPERKTLAAEFKIEVAHLKLFWWVFIKTDGHLVDDEHLNEVGIEEL
jgi:hypothetical protein